MTTGSDLIGFMDAAREDPRLGPLHLSVYLALFYLAAKQDGDFICVRASTVMPLAKIRSDNPFYKVMRELDAYGYIRYAPSCDATVGSRVWLRR